MDTTHQPSHGWGSRRRQPCMGISSPFNTNPPAHIQDMPPSREPLHISGPTRRRVPLQNNKTGAEEVIYFVPAGKQAVRPGYTNYVKKMPRFYNLTGENDRTLIFDARFESGNLEKVVKISEGEYELFLRSDYNSKANTVQWFYFSVRNTFRGHRVRIHIRNLYKPRSLYSEGMRPLTYSTIAAKKCHRGWRRGGDCIWYFQEDGKYTLSFTYTFSHDADTVFFSHCYPYTLSDLEKHLHNLGHSPHCQRRVLGHSLAGNRLHLCRITNFSSPEHDVRKRGAIVLSARVHPGESNSSVIMEGILDFLVSDDVVAEVLRDRFVFLIIPMLNPDGVAVGNTRCNLAGLDLNRQWNASKRKLKRNAPTIYAMKQLLQRVCDERPLDFFVDFHGHSRKKNVFIYGCDNPRGSSRYLAEEVFPHILSEVSPIFSFDDCCFAVQKSKESCARVVVRRAHSILNSYTLECSFCGSSRGSFSGAHYAVHHLRQMGEDFCRAIFVYQSIEKRDRSLSFLRSCDGDVKNSRIEEDKVEHEDIIMDVVDEISEKDTESDIQSCDNVDLASVESHDGFEEKRRSGSGMSSIIDDSEQKERGEITEESCEVEETIEMLEPNAPLPVIEPKIGVTVLRTPPPSSEQKPPRINPFVETVKSRSEEKPPQSVNTSSSTTSSSGILRRKPMLVRRNKKPSSMAKESSHSSSSSLILPELRHTVSEGRARNDEWDIRGSRFRKWTTNVSFPTLMYPSPRTTSIAFPKEVGEEDKHDKSWKERGAWGVWKGRSEGMSRAQVLLLLKKKREIEQQKRDRMRDLLNVRRRLLGLAPTDEK